MDVHWYTSVPNPLGKTGVMVRYNKSEDLLSVYLNGPISGITREIEKKIMNMIFRFLRNSICSNSISGEPWVYIGTPLPNPSGNTGVMVVYAV